MTIQLNERIKITAPDSFVPKPLPYHKIWVEALKSKIFKQGNGVLCHDDSYCCLGVLSEIQGRLTDKGGDDVDSISACFLTSTNPCFSQLSISGTFPAGCAVSMKDYFFGITHLSALNDAGASFEDIAEVIQFFWKE